MIYVKCQCVKFSGYKYIAFFAITEIYVLFFAKKAPLAGIARSLGFQNGTISVSMQSLYGAGCNYI